MSQDPASLDLLHDVITPPPVPWWPPAPGWYWALGCATLLITVLIIRVFLLWQRNRYRREALAEWERQRPLLTDSSKRAETLAGLAELLKRTALTAFPRRQVAALTGPEWMEFLSQTGGTDGTTTNAGATLEQIAYDPRTAAELDEQRTEEAAGFVRRWLVHHDTKGGSSC